MRFAGGHHEIVGLVLLQHQMHGLHIVAGEAPVAAGVHAAHRQLMLQLVGDPGGVVCDLAGHELHPAPFALVIEQDARRRMHPIRLAIVDSDPVPVHLGHAVRAAGIERCGFDLRHGLHLAKHLRRTGLVKAHRRVHRADGVEHSGYPQRRGFAGEHGLRPTGLYEALGGEVVDLLRTVLGQQRDDGGLVQQIAAHQGHPVLDV